MFVSREFTVHSFEVEQNALTRVASDHLPLSAVLEWNPELAQPVSENLAAPAVTASIQQSSVASAERGDAQRRES